MAGYTYANLTTDIRNYTEVDANVFTAAVINRFLENAEHRINLDIPMDSDRIQAEAQFATDFNSITVPTKALFIRGVQVFDSTSATTGEGVWLERRDQTFISEYIGELTGTSKEVLQLKIQQDFLNTILCMGVPQQVLILLHQELYM